MTAATSSTQPSLCPLFAAETTQTKAQAEKQKPSMNELFVINIARQNGLFLNKNASHQDCLHILRKTGYKVKRISLEDTNMTKERFQIIVDYFPNIQQVNVLGAYHNNTMICSRGEIQQYFRFPSLVEVIGVEANTYHFLELLQLQRTHTA